MIKILHSSKILSNQPVVYPVFSDGDGLRLAGGEISPVLLSEAREDGFAGKAGSVAVLRPRTRGDVARVLLVGLGKQEDVDGNTLRLAAAAVVRHSVEAHLPHVQFVLPDPKIFETVQFPHPALRATFPQEGKENRDIPSPLGRPFAGLPAPGAAEPLMRGQGEGGKRFSPFVQAVVEGAMLGSYCFDAYKSKAGKRPGIKELALIFTEKKAAKAAGDAARGEAFGEAVNFARELINRPASDKRPEVLAKVARSLAGKGVTVRIFKKADLKRLGANALLGVNRGSAHPPVMVHFRYRPTGKPRGSVAFVGKGVTFDSGGLSLKPADGMMTMKYDMAGAATVFAVFKALRELKPRIEVHGVAVLTENMPGPDAYKPGDVVKAMNGKTIEVLNTDAEGRVILADALSFAARLNADAIIDVATLTGAASVALGKAYAALMSNNPSLEQDLRDAGAVAGEKMWPLPLEKSYVEHIQSKVADFKNIGNPGEAGTIIGGLFLQQFAGEGPWAHVDMASVGWNGNGSLLSPPGATGALVRTFLTYVMNKGKNK